MFCRFHYSQGDIIWVLITFVGVLIVGAVLFFYDYIFDYHFCKFKSVKAECYYYKEKFPDNPHSILAVLTRTPTDYFVLAYFEGNYEMRPAVYTIKRKQISYLNLRVEETYFKKIYLSDESQKYVRAYRIKNKSTKSQMLFFASDIENLKIQINNQPVPKMDCGDKTGEFYVYGIFEKDELYNSVNINGYDYPLVESPLKVVFIGKSEVWI